MNAGSVLKTLSDFAGVIPEFVDLDGVTREIAPETGRALLRANGLAADTDAEAKETLDVLKAAEATAWTPQDVIVQGGVKTCIVVRGGSEWQLLAEETDQLLAEGRVLQGQIDLPALPPGVHRLCIVSGKVRQEATLIVTPGRAPDLRDVGASEKIWGVMTALYGLRSDRNGGLGDFRDLGDLAQTAGHMGAGFLGINPVHAPGWAAADSISPYSPTHRGFLNPAHIAVDEFSGTARNPDACTGSLICHKEHTTWHRTQLQSAWRDFEAGASDADRAAFAQFCVQGGDALDQFAQFEALSECHGADWRTWPVVLQVPQPLMGRERSNDWRFHAWLQWVADRQLALAQDKALNAGMRPGLYLDLAVGARLGGAEPWAMQEAMAGGVSVGAPPDHLSPAGQNWQLAGFAPRKLSQRRYAPLRQLLARTMRHCGILRIDHALGLNRSFWIPEDGSPGGYVRQPFRSLLAIVAIEAQRAGTVIVGEDLGLVPDGFRDEIATHGFYGYTVWQYEKTEAHSFRKPSGFRPQSLACFATHDTPTIRGYATSRDIDWWEKLGWISAEKVPGARADRSRELAALPAGRDALHDALAQGASALVAVQLDDILDAVETQNLPGTTDEHPNWRRRAALPVEQVASHTGFGATARIMKDAGRAQQKNKKG